MPKSGLACRSFALFISVSSAFFAMGTSCALSDGKHHNMAS